MMPRPTSDNSHGDAMLDHLAAEYDEDARRMKWTVTMAAVLHAVLLLVTVPELVPPPRDAPMRTHKLFVVQQVRFKPPPAPPRRARPQTSAKRIPIPDPTPQDPEPIVVEDVEIPEIDLLDGLDVNFGIPEAPPSTGAGLDGWGDALEVGGNVLGPVKVFAPQPRYTEEARKARVQGMVLLRTVIDKQGDVAAVELLKGLELGLSESAIETVRTWKYEPATQDGEPVPVFMFISVNFRLT